MAAPCRPGPTLLEPIEARGLSLRHLHHAFGILGRMGMSRFTRVGTLAVIPTTLEKKIDSDDSLKLQENGLNIENWVISAMEIECHLDRFVHSDRNYR